jgi:hypothetical protein
MAIAAASSAIPTDGEWEYIGHSIIPDGFKKMP